MTKPINFTKEALDRIEFRETQYDIGDTRVFGLRLRINPGGSKTFMLYRKIEGKPSRIKLGRFPELTVENARKMAASLNGQIAEGRNPLTEKQGSRAELTFGALFDRYYTEHSLSFNRNPKNNKRVIELHVLPEWGKLKLSAITREKTRRLHHTIAQKFLDGVGRSTANKALTLSRAVFSFGIRHGYYAGTNPCLGFQKFKEESRDRFLSQLEIERFLQAVNQEKQDARDFFLLALFTGARKSNILAMRFEDIDFGLRRLRIPAIEAKNGDVNIVVLSRPALAILKWRQRGNNRKDQPNSTFSITSLRKVKHSET